MRPVTGLRFTWQSNTLMKIDTRGSGRSPRSSSCGGTALMTWLTRPSAGATTMPSRTGVTRAGSRKNSAHQSVSTVPIQPSGDQSQNRIEAHERKDADERIALAMDRHELRADRGEDGHGITPLRLRRTRAHPAASAVGALGRSIRRRPAHVLGDRRRIAVGRGRQSSSISASFSRAASASRWRFHMLA